MERVVAAAPFFLPFGIEGDGNEFEDHGWVVGGDRVVRSCPYEHVLAIGAPSGSTSEEIVTGSIVMMSATRSDQT